MTSLENGNSEYREIDISLKHEIDRSYAVVIGHNFGNYLPNEIINSADASSYTVVCDTTTAKLAGEKLVEQLRELNAKANLVCVECGEQSKSLTVLENVLSRFLEFGLDRKSCVIAVGGGVVGDLAGFAAGCFMRGVKYIQVPTTLLAQVDSSVGGKVAVNIAQGKNYCGMFLQPQKVLIDVKYLLTLSDDHYLEGLGEVVKYACIIPGELHDFLLANAEAIKQRDSLIMASVVEKCCRIKAQIVEEDECEQGVRMVLNYGHTFGHAIEACTDYGVPHGLAVAYGMRAAAATAREMKMLSGEDFLRHETLLDTFNLATSPLHFDVSRAAELLVADKKSTNGKPQFILPRSMGDVLVTSDVPPSLAKTSLHLLTILTEKNP